MITFQDFCKASDKVQFVATAISSHKGTEMYCTALDADRYDHQCNTTICDFVKTIMSSTGSKIIDVTSANNKIASNFFHRLNTQRNMYSLGNGITFTDDKVAEKLGPKFDTIMKKAGYYALIHGVSFVFWNVDRLYVFPLTEFVPLWDEDSGALAAGIRFWQIATDKPLTAVLYETDGYTKLRDDGTGLIITEAKRGYKQKVLSTPADGPEVIGEENYTSLPIVPLWGSDLKQSTLIGMQRSIDSYDLIRSGFANDLTDCAQIYWIIKNACGMDEDSLSRFREQLLLRHIATVDSESGVDISPYTQEIPFQARGNYLDRIRTGIYEDFGALDVFSITGAAKTATEIEAAYQPLDENADDYEYQIIECVQHILALQGVDGEDAIPIFKRSRITNQMEQVQIVTMEAPYLDDETILKKLPNVTPDEVTAILKKKDAEETERTERTVPDDFGPNQTEPDNEEETGGED